MLVRPSPPSPPHAQLPTRRTALRAAGAGALALGASGGLVGCRSAVSVAAGQGGARRGGSLTVGIPVDFTPALLFTQSDQALQQRLIYNTLIRYDDKLEPQPELARSWKYADDGRSITLKLRDDVTFHDGRAFTADDVIFAVENLRKPERSAQLAATAKAVTGFEKRGDHEIVLEFAHPVANLFDLFEFMIITDRHTLQDTLKGRKLNGTGPFRFDGWRPGTGIGLSRNDRYWIPERPYLDSVELRVYSHPDALLSALRSGQAQLSYGVSGKHLAPLKAVENFTIKRYDTGSGAAYVGASVGTEPADNKEFRQAVAWAVDRERVVQQALGGYGLPSAAPWPKSSPAHTEANRTHYTHNPGKARELLKASGVSTSRPVPLGHPTQPLHTSVAEIVQYDLQQAGIRTELRPYDSATFQKRLISGTMPALWVNLHAFAQVHPATLAVSAYPFNEAKNTSGYRDKEYTDAVRAAWQHKDEDGPEAHARYQRISDLLLEEAFIIDLAVQDQVEVAAARLRGATINKFSYLNLDHAYLA
ncbi:Oligopeptide-binding protein AppA precursor [Streptomyces sp. YIM 130001]|uniref:ABC transporter substrate-binding protein n=1 Tax=Streptomyces sp. YIM 130001 TaxID=2259644 RepID=UPI000E65CA1E|nr:ABC transporter substrate-binding protein [Streptomyces sp. YIM 130001]RII17794.1 Oligopeptide-binding protein AppA precursor [Streptomyces sp. YIM 130001]